MKKKLLLLTSLFCCCLLNGQTTKREEFTGKDSLVPKEFKAKGINFGVSVGYNFAHNTLYEASLSPIDHTFSIATLPKNSFVISTALSFPLTRGKLGGATYTKIDNAGKPIGEPYYVPWGLCLIATLNIATFNEASNGSIFNKQIDGGLGIGYRLDDHFQIALAYEMISFRQPKQFLIDQYQGKVINVGDQKLISLDEKDNNFFHNKYVGSISLKLIYLIKFGKTD